MPSALAKRIARAHNGLRRTVLEHGVLVFSPGGFAVEPMPAEDAPKLDLERLLMPVQDHYVTVSEVQQLLDEYLAEQATAREARDRAREESRARHSIRVAEAERDYGHKRGAARCFSCNSFKSKPSAICGRCGDDPVTHNGDRREFDRAHGRAA